MTEQIVIESVPFFGVWLWVWLISAAFILLVCIVTAVDVKEGSVASIGVAVAVFVTLFAMTAAATGVSEERQARGTAALTDAGYLNVALTEEEFTASDKDGKYVQALLWEMPNSKPGTITYQILPIGVD